MYRKSMGCFRFPSSVPCSILNFNWTVAHFTRMAGNTERPQKIAVSVAAHASDALIESQLYCQFIRICNAWWGTGGPRRWTIANENGNCRQMKVVPTSLGKNKYLKTFKLAGEATAQRKSPTNTKTKAKRAHKATYKSEKVWIARCVRYCQSSILGWLPKSIRSNYHVWCTSRRMHIITETDGFACGFASVEWNAQIYARQRMKNDDSGGPRATLLAKTVFQLFLFRRVISLSWEH